MQEERFSSDKIFNLDSQAKELGMGGKLSPESDEISYKKRMKQRKEIQSKRLKLLKFAERNGVRIFTLDYGKKEKFIDIDPLTLNIDLQTL